MSDILEWIKNIHKTILSKADEGQRWYPHDDKTFCNSAVYYGLGQLGVDRTGFNSGIYAAKANKMAEFLARESQSAGGKWLELHNKPAIQDLANHGITVVAAWKNPNPKESGHVALVHPGNDDWLNHPGAPFLTNVGSKNNLGVIPHTRSHEGDFSFYTHQADPQLGKLFDKAQQETAPNFMGPPSPSTSWLRDVCDRARMETSPNFMGPPSPSTTFMQQMGLTR